MKTCLSFGAGVQTTALLVLIGEERWPRPDAIVFSDTGDEHQATYDYMASYSGPYAREHGLEIVVLDEDWRAGQYKMSLEEYCIAHRMLPGTWVRWCTVNYKIKPIGRYLRAHLGASKTEPVESWIGISADEPQRAVVSPDPREVKRYPLIELGLSRADCEAVIQAAGLPVPPKSCCWYCPFQNQAKWQKLKREQPLLFERALAMEHHAQGKGGKKKYLPMFGSLERIAMSEEFPGFDAIVEAEGKCVTGSCFV